MTRLIDVDALIAPLKAEYKKLKQAFDETSVFQAPNDVALYGALMQEVGAVIGIIEGAQTVDAEPVRHGKWIRDEFGARCGACGLYAYRDKFGQPWESPYCPICGARMDNREERRWQRHRQ